MSSTEERLEATARILAEKGDDGQRLELVQRARRFKRSWVEMAEALSFVRDTHAYKRWGFSDLNAYCNQELQLRASAVEKLLGSYSTLRRHAPEVLQRDGVARSIPTADAVDYYARAVGPRPGAEAQVTDDPELLSELHKAVFEENKPLPAIRRQFNSLLNPKSEATVELETVAKLRSALRRVTSLIDQLETLPASRVDTVKKTLRALEDDLEAIDATDDKKLAS